MSSSDPSAIRYPPAAGEGATEPGWGNYTVAMALLAQQGFVDR